MGLYTIEVIQTPKYASGATAQASVTYDSFTLTVGCVITAIADFVVPTQAIRTYVLYSPSKKIDMAVSDNSNMIQTPNCGYTPTVSYSYSIPAEAAAFVSVDGTISSQINIMTNNPAHVAISAYAVTLTVTIIDTQSVTYGGTANQHYDKNSISIPIFVTDPCASTTLNRVKVAGTANFMSSGAFSVTDGQSQTRDFTKATDTVEIAQGIPTLCGSRIYRLCYDATCSTVSGQTTVTWVTIAAKTGVTDTFMLTATPNTITQSG